MIQKILYAMRLKSWMNLSPYAFSVFTVFLPISKTKSDLWDGQIIQYAIKNQDFRGLDSWFGMSGWEFQLLFIKLENLISNVTSVGFNSINRALIFASFVLLIRQTMFIARVILNQTGKIVVLSGLLLGSMPVWSNLTSSVLTIHLFCLAIGLYGLELIISESKKKVLIGYILVLMSFQLNSLLMFIPGIYLVYLYEKSSQITLARNAIYKLGILLFLSLGYFVTQKIFNPNSSMYSDYNVILNPLNFDNLKVIAVNTAHFSSFLALPLLSTLLNFSNNLALLRGKVDFFERRAFLRQIFSILCLILFSVTPYLLVGKSSNISDYSDWSYRQAFLLVVPLSILTSKLLIGAPIRKNNSSSGAKYKSILISVVLLSTSVSLLEMSFATRINRAEFDQHLIMTLGNLPKEPVPGALQITGEGIPGPTIRSYEANFISYQSFGNLGHWTRISQNRNPNFGITALEMTLPNSQIIFAGNELTCETELHLSIDGFSEPAEVLLNIFSLKKSRSIEVQTFNSSCK